MAKAPAQSPDPLQTEQDIRKAIRRFERRLSDLAAFEPSSVTARNDPKIDVLEAAISEALHETYVENAAPYRRYVQAATLDTAGINMNGTPHHKVIEGLVHGKERSIALLQQAIRALQEKLDDDFPAPSVGPKGPPLQDHNAEMRPHGSIPADATSSGEITLDARLQVLDPPEVRFELLQARVALLEAALSAPRPAGTVGMGHNRGPELDAPAELEEIDRFIALLKEQTPTTPTDRSKLLEAAQVADQKAKGGREYLDELAKGVIKGGSEEIGKRLVQSPWWIAVYAQLDSVVHAVIAWLSSLPPI